MNKYESKYFNTSKKMGDSLISLLEKKDFEYITVKDICEKAGVNRSTFYLHYENTTDLLQDVIDRMNDSFVEHYKERRSLEVEGKTLEELYLITDENLNPYLDFIYQNRYVYKAMKTKPHIFNVNSKYEEMYDRLFSPILSKYGVSNTEKKYVMNYYMNGVSSIIMTWVDNECSLSKETVVRIIKDCVRGQKE